jgi:hypothetical protein
MTDDIEPAPEAEVTAEQTRPASNDITRQVTRLARAIDRLPPGDYVIQLEKGDRLCPWRATILVEERQVLRVMDLWR